MEQDKSWNRTNKSWNRTEQEEQVMKQDRVGGTGYGTRQIMEQDKQIMVQDRLHTPHGTKHNNHKQTG